MHMNIFSCLFYFFPVHPPVFPQLPLKAVSIRDFNFVYKNKTLPSIVLYISDLHTHTHSQEHPLSSSTRGVWWGWLGGSGFVSIPGCARIATRVWNTNEDRFRPRCRFHSHSRFRPVSRFSSSSAVFGSRQSSVHSIRH